jgi:hypothetical protein
LSCKAGKINDDDGKKFWAEKLGKASKLGTEIFGPVSDGWRVWGCRVCHLGAEDLERETVNI